MAKLMKNDEEAKSGDAYIGPPALMAIRTMKNDGTGYSPSMLLYGYYEMQNSVYLGYLLDMTMLLVKSMKKMKGALLKLKVGSNKFVKMLSIRLKLRRRSVKKSTI